MMDNTECHKTRPTITHSKSCAICSECDCLVTSTINL